jgi:hypothetical protein
MRRLAPTGLPEPRGLADCFGAPRNADDSRPFSEMWLDVMKGGRATWTTRAPYFGASLRVTWCPACSFTLFGFE